MQLEFGLDGVPPAADGVADFYTEFSGLPMPGTNTLSRIVAVRVHLLARSSAGESSYKNEKRYTLGGPQGSVWDIANDGDPSNDNLYFRTLSSLVLLRNPATRLAPFALPD